MILSLIKCMFNKGQVTLRQTMSFWKNYLPCEKFAHYIINLKKLQQALYVAKNKLRIGKSYPNHVIQDFSALILSKSC